MRRLCGVRSKQDLEKQGLIRNIKFCHEKKQKQQVCVWFTNVKAIAFGWRGRWKLVVEVSKCFRSQGAGKVRKGIQ